MAIPAPARTLSTLEILIGYATRAPSSHNSQPWRFVTAGPSDIRLFADRSRRLPVGDPEGRELTMSCGAALENLVVAARGFGFVARVHAMPDPAWPDLLASVRIEPGDWPTDDELLLFDAIERRHTSRAHFAADPVSPWLVESLVGVASTREAALVPVRDAAGRGMLRALVEEGDRQLFADAAWRGELASWIRSPRQSDGMALGCVPALLARLTLRAVDVGSAVCAADRALIERAPLLAVIGTADDTPASWLAAGRALERVLLTATRYGLQAGFLNQPVQVAALRTQLGRLVGCRCPQAVLRLGHPASALRATPRRAIEDVIVDAEARAWADARAAAFGCAAQA